MSASIKVLSGSTDNNLIKVTGTATGTSVTVHTASAGDNLVWVWAYNNHTADVKLTLEWGGATAPDDLIEVTIPYKAGLYLVAPGLYLSGSLAVKAWAATANVIYLTGKAYDASASDQTLSMIPFSGSTNGRAVKPTATATPGTTIHTADATAEDEIFAYAMNYNAANQQITIEWSGTGADNQILQTIPGEDGPHLIIPGIPLTNSGTLKIFSNPVAVNVFGHVIRHT